MKNMNCVNTMPEIMPEITDEAIIEALFAQRPYEEKVINSAFLEIPADYQRGLSIPNTPFSCKSRLPKTGGFCYI